MAALCLVAASTGPASAAAPQPVVQGNRIIDSVTGAAFVPRGVNFPSFEYACQQGWGYSNLGASETSSMATAAETAAAMAAWKINTVRIPLNQDCWLGDDGLPFTDLTRKGFGVTLTSIGYRVAVIEFVEALNDQGIVAVPDLHWSSPDGILSDGLRVMADNRSDDFWTSVAASFKTHPSVMFDLFNEPHSRWSDAGGRWAFQLSWECWKSGGCQGPVENDKTPLPTSAGSTFTTMGMKELVAAVRVTGAKQPIILGGRDYANDLGGWLGHRPDDDQLIAGFHNYVDQNCDNPTCWSTEIAPVASEVPVITGEIGQRTCDVGTTSHMNSYMRWADNRSIGYLAWAWWPANNGDCSNFAMLSNQDGTPNAPVGTAFRDHLLYVNSHPTTGTPDNPGPDPDPVGPDPVDKTKRRDARLVIANARFRHGMLTFKVKSKTKATGKVKVRVFVRSDRGATSSESSEAKLRSGSAVFGFKVRSDYRPTRIIARYPGTQKFKADSAVRRIR